MLYPMLNSEITLGSFEDDDGSVSYYAENDEGTVFDITEELYNALSYADGTEPLRLPHNGKDIIPELKELGLIRTSRFIKDKGIYNRFVLFPVGKKANRLKQILAVLNKCLPLFSVMILVAGTAFKLLYKTASNEAANSSLAFIMALLSVMLHEFGHFQAAIAYDYTVTDVGFLLLGVIPVGAYVAASEENGNNKGSVRFYLAGIMINLLLAGALFIASNLSYAFSVVLEVAAEVNLILAGVNLLLPIKGLDGEAAMSATLDIESVSTMAKKILHNRKYRKELRSKGFYGHILLTVFTSVYVLKAVFVIAFIVYIATFFGILF